MRFASALFVKKIKELRHLVGWRIDGVRKSALKTRPLFRDLIHCYCCPPKRKHANGLGLKHQTQVLNATSKRKH